MSLIAAVGLWEFLKYVKNKIGLWWSARQRRNARAERLRHRTRDAVQEELHRRELELTPRIPPTRASMSSTGRRQATHTTHRDADIWQVSSSVGVQTDPQPAMIPANRLEAYTGPFYITTHGDRVHMTSYCHGQRNATRASKRYDLCDYCDRARGLYVLDTSRRMTVRWRGGVQRICADLCRASRRASCAQKLMRLLAGRVAQGKTSAVCLP